MRNVKKVLYMAIIGLVCWGIGPGYCLAGESGHYVNGAEGIKAATLPPPGFYYRMYNVFYTADTLADQDGNALNVNFDAGIYAMVNRFIWITDVKLLGGNFLRVFEHVWGS